MTTEIQMKRFGGIFSDEAKAYGPGAFEWSSDGHGCRYLNFRAPNGYPDDWGIHSIPIEPVGHEGPSWSWDGNEDSPTVSPSISTKHVEDGKLVEHFHCWIKNGVIELLPV